MFKSLIYIRYTLFYLDIGKFSSVFYCIYSKMLKTVIFISDLHVFIKKKLVSDKFLCFNVFIDKILILSFFSQIYPFCLRNCKISLSWKNWTSLIFISDLPFYWEIEDSEKFLSFTVFMKNVKISHIYIWFTIIQTIFSQFF